MTKGGEIECACYGCRFEYGDDPGGPGCTSDETLNLFEAFQPACPVSLIPTIGGFEYEVFSRCSEHHYAGDD